MTIISIPSNLIPLFVAAGQAADVPPALAAAICARETGFVADAINEKSGAAGIAQFMLDTWRECWGKWGDPGREGDPLNPADAIPMQCHYLAWLREQFCDRWHIDGVEREWNVGLIWIVALSYNWGIGNVNGWLEAGAQQVALPPERCEYANDVLYLYLIMRARGELQNMSGASFQRVILPDGSSCWTIDFGGEEDEGA